MSCSTHTSEKIDVQHISILQTVCSRTSMVQSLPTFGGLYVSAGCLQRAVICSDNAPACLPASPTAAAVLGPGTALW